MPAPTTPIRKRWRIRILAGVVVIAAIMAVVMTSPRETPDEFVWMTPAQVAQSLTPGRLTRLKYKVMRWPGPWRWFPRSKRVIRIHMQVLAVTNGVVPAFAQVDSCWTNRDNKVAWIAGPDDLKEVEQNLKDSGAKTKGEMSLTVPDGMQASMASGTAIPATSSFSGTSAQLLAKIEHVKFNLLVEATSSEPAPPHAILTAGVQTNLSIACRALVPNGGALIVEGAGNGVSGTNYYMIISCVAIDSKGNPITLKR